MKIVLIGFRGSGKSTVGELLARQLGWPFFDTDTLVRQRAGLAISEIFKQCGERHFRQLERQAVAECAARDPAVIATGGGAVLDAGNVATLRQNGFVVHLSARPEVLWNRIVRDEATSSTRPALLPNAASGLEEIRQLLIVRASIYAQARDAEVTVEDRTPAEVAHAVLILLRARGVLPPAT